MCVGNKELQLGDTNNYLFQLLVVSPTRQHFTSISLCYFDPTLVH